MRAIPPELQSLHSVVAAVLDTQGTLLEANAGFARRLGSGPGRQVGDKVAECILMPGFRELAASRPLPGGDVYRGTIRFRDAGGETVQLRARVWRSAHGLCLLAESESGAGGVEARASEALTAGRPEREATPLDAASLDPLTGTANRAWLDQCLAAEAAAAQAEGTPLCVLMAGADRFDAVVARYGRAGGDKALARCGFLLRLLTRPGDLAARFGAAEFAVLLPRTNVAQAVSAADRIRRAFENDITEPLGEALSVSFGLAEYRAGEPAGALLGRAAGALERAREAGGNRVIVYSGG